MSTCTSGKCEWKRRCGNIEYAILFQGLKIVKAEFRKTGMLRRGLQEVFPKMWHYNFCEGPENPKSRTL